MLQRLRGTPVLLRSSVTKCNTTRSLIFQSPRRAMTNTTADISAGTATSTSATASQSPTEQPLIMQLIIDRNLIGDPHWTLGPLLAQASHATAAIIARTLPTCPQTQEYVSSENLPNMHKVTLKTASKGAGADLRELSKKLDEAKSELGNDFPEHHLWIEQPENIPTCIAIAPNRKPQALKKILNKCSLLRD